MMRIVFIPIILLLSLTVHAQHNVILKTGEKLKGVVLMIQHDTLHMSVNTNMKYIELKYVSSIFFDEYVAYDGRLLLDENVKTMMSGEYLIEYQMKDRNLVKPPTVSVGSGDKGKVVVEVTVNRSGLVMNAVPGITGSTTSNEYLLTKAKFASQGARFDKSLVAPVEQKGTIIISY
ncbi:MAG TPA: hypothetical protein EYN71_03110 [Flavobacteriales bacterium]|nr:hypothetical protein [Flavobacteriales bacterium]HIO68237.1 hypothetical protein [Flavobacteriales bacterium]